MSRWTGILVVSAALVMLLSSRVNAGPMPLPLDGQVDLAQTIVVGKIVSLKDTSKDSLGIERATATIEVQEVLKGPKDTKTLDVPVATLVPYTEKPLPMSSLPHTYKKGDEGVWIVMPWGGLGHRRLDKEDAKLVKDALAAVEKRFWATPANGLAAWAGFSKLDTEQKGELMFAIKNTTKESIYLPWPHYKGVLTVEVDNVPTGNALVTVASRDQGGGSAPDENTLALEIKPGQTLYYHPAVNEMSLRLPEKVPAGKYWVQVLVHSSIKQLTLLHDGKERKVDAWTGVLVSPAVDWAAPAAATTSQPAPKQADAAKG